MALTQEQSAQLMTNPVFRGRIKVCCITFATSIFNEAPTVPAHNARFKWATQTYAQPDLVAQQVQNPVTMDPAVQEAAIDPEDGDSTIGEAELQAAVQVTVNKMI